MEGTLDCKQHEQEEGTAGQISKLSGLVTELMAHKMQTLKENDYYGVPLGFPH